MCKRTAKRYTKLILDTLLLLYTNNVTGIIVQLDDNIFSINFNDTTLSELNELIEDAPDTEILRFIKRKEVI